ncbi:hypothetical protein D1007_34603 [Hordeum vulgare]|nr:hypothetical protein D1007_34603 [Hordeum vulgare]KAI4990847.1 hypothetical protein ZWY2020_039218 [Hordeum vulgare]
MAAPAGLDPSTGWSGKNLEEMMEFLDLKDDELDDVIVGNKEVQRLEADARWMAIGKLNTSHPFSSTAMFEIVKAVWGLAQAPKHREAGDNLFVFRDVLPRRLEEGCTLWPVALQG